MMKPFRPRFRYARFSPLRLLLVGAFGFGLCGCDAKSSSAVSTAPSSAETSSKAAVVSPSPSVKSYSYEVLNAWPHDPEAFTQGLIYLKGILVESTGLNGRSSLRKVELETGHVRSEVKVPSEYFAEGMTVIGSKVFQLTWQNHTGFVYDLQTFEKLGEFSYTGEGWGLTTDGKSLIMSDGSHELRFLDPSTFKVTRTIQVFDHAGAPLKMLNELELIHGEIFANVWQTPYVVRIDPATGRLLGVIDFTGLLSPQDRQPNTDVLNGIAYDAKNDRIFVTGKNWPKLFEVRLKSAN